jgi:hypothetical protein
MRKLTAFQDGFIEVSLWEGDEESPTKEDFRVTFWFDGKEITVPAEHLGCLARAAADAETLIEYHRQLIPFEKFYVENNFDFQEPTEDARQVGSRSQEPDTPGSTHEYDGSPGVEVEPS